MARKHRDKAQFGDFQTPPALALDVLRLVKRLGVDARTVIEPSCGKGAFLVAAADVYPEAHISAIEINGDYLADAKAAIANHARKEFIHASFFDVDWDELIGGSKEPILIVGNPPWVTNSELGSLGSSNLPAKSNFQKLSGFDAVTGKSNFDISEWMLLQNLSWLQARKGALAVLCKTAVARKVARFAWKHRIKMSDARIYPIDAGKQFGAAVDACLFYAEVDGSNAVHECGIYPTFDAAEPQQTFGFMDGSLVSDVRDYQRFRHLRASSGPKWRSGVKHDCSKVMELDQRGSKFVNGLGEEVELEDTFLYPLAKSSDVGGKRPRDGEKFVIVTQRKIGDDTGHIREEAPLTWAYLEAHEALINGRTSVIYKDKPRFSIFGVGDYTFSPFKVAISGLYKGLDFKLFSPKFGKPVLFDDTVYFLPFEAKSDAETALKLLTSEDAQAFLRSMIFWADKRPVTADLLRRLDLERLANELGEGGSNLLGKPPLPLFATAD
jgi:hypothetical protein